MTHDQLYMWVSAFNLLALGYCYGKLVGRKEGAHEGGYWGAKEAVRLLRENGYLVDSEDDEEDDDKP